MKKIGILTYHFSNNYGALFQAYGLYKYLTDLGHEVDFINYHPEHIESGGDLTFKNIFTKSGLKIIYLKLTSLKENYFGNENIKSGFFNFRKNYLGVKGIEYTNIDDINNAKLDYDILICGSDQIWNPSEHFGVDPIYFLDFETKNDPMKISYAPSFGRSNIETKYHDEISIFVSKLEYVSAREKSGVELLEKLTNKKISLVPDSTVLIENYKEVMKPYDSKLSNYIFCYYLRNRENIGEIAEYISNKTDSKIYSPHNSHRRWKEIGETIYPSPNQWLDILFNSNIVITNSFHGTILSIILNRPFIVVGIGGNKAKYNERVSNLLSQCNLESRLINEYNKKKVDAILNENIDWNLVNQKISIMRKQGVNFLNNALKGTFNE